MKKKGLFVAAFFGFILLTSTVTIAIPGLIPEDENAPEITVTGTPADNFPDEDRAQLCGSSNAKSTDFVQEFSIPTVCTQPLAIATDRDGNVWFAQTNTGKLAKFDPNIEQFEEYENPIWPQGGNSMIWGMDYASDGSLWFTDDAYDSVWKFSPEDKKYEVLSYPSEGTTFPQRLQVDGSQIIINDFSGNKITFLDPNRPDENVNYLSVPSPIDNSVTGDFAIDDNDNIWFTNWLFLQGGVLVKFNQNSYLNSIANVEEQSLPLLDHIEIFELPTNIIAPNGAVASDDGIIWLADTGSSSFFSFDPKTEQFIRYVTADPMFNTYGNQTGIVQNPISRPYWIDTDDKGQLVFNSQTANNISIMDPKTQSLVEYHIPSKNPNWSDCDPGTGFKLPNCGIAQVFDFAIHEDKIWFTEWAENNIGVVDTSVPLPIEIQLESFTTTINPGGEHVQSFMILPQVQNDSMDVSLVLSSGSEFLDVAFSDDLSIPFQLDPDTPKTINVKISASEDILPGTYKVLFGAQSPDVAISKFLTVTVE